MIKTAKSLFSIKKYFNELYFNMVWSLYKQLYNSSKYGNNIILNGIPLFKFYGKVIFGDNLIFNSLTQYNTVGIFKKCSIFVAPNAILKIGNNTGFSGVSIHCEKEILIGSYCNIGGNVCIWDTDFHSLDYLNRRKLIISDVKSKEIIIGDDVFIGANAIILKGVRIGDRAIIGAGSIITSDIPDEEIWAGNPAKFIRKNITNYD